MVKTGGFIVIHRQILDWEWYGDTNTFRMFLHLLLTANYEDGRFEGIEVKRGQVVTSLASLSQKTQQSIQQVRTSLQHLILTGEITSKAYPKFRVITIVNYDKYQDKQQGNQQANNKQSTSIPTSKGPSNQQQYNKNNNINKLTREQMSLTGHTPPDRLDETFDQFWEAYPRKTSKPEAKRAWMKIKPGPLTFGEIMAGLAKWIVSDDWQRDGGRFIPYPATWLNNQRWQDEVKPASKTSTSKPVKQVIAQDYEQRDYSQVQNDIEAAMRRDMELYLRGDKT